MRLIGCGIPLLVIVAVALPHFVKARWVSVGVPVLFKVSVVDAQTGQPVSRAKVLHWTHWDEGWFHAGDSMGRQSAITDDTGTCEVHSAFPGSGSGNKGHLKPDWTLWVRAEGYEPWQNPVSALLGSAVSVSNPFQISSYPLKIVLKRK